MFNKLYYSILNIYDIILKYFASLRIFEIFLVFFLQMSSIRRIDNIAEYILSLMLIFFVMLK